MSEKDESTSGNSRLTGLEGLFRGMLTVSSGLLQPGELRKVEVRSSLDFFPSRTMIAEVSRGLRIEAVVIRSYRSGDSIVAGGDRPADEAQIHEALRQFIIPCSSDLTFVVQNPGHAAASLVCGVVGYFSAVQLWERYQADRGQTRMFPLDERQRQIAELTEDQVCELDARWSLCAGGATRKNASELTRRRS